MGIRARAHDKLRDILIEPGFSTSAASVIFRMGETVVHCTALAEERVPPFVQEGHGWLTAEYAMLPASSSRRIQRSSRSGSVDGRSQEIQRLIGRSLRSVVDLSAMGSRTIYLDCDVLNADGGTRCASICGAYIALSLSLRRLQREGLLTADRVLREDVAAVSVGIVGGEALLDLAYVEDSRAEVDMNLVMTGSGKLIEIQGTGERTTFSFEQLHTMLALGQQGIEALLAASRAYLAKQ